MEKFELKSVIEALIFVSEEPMSIDLMAMVFEEMGVKKKELRDILEEIKNDYNGSPERGVQVVEVAGGYQFRTKPACAEWIQKLNVPKPVRLSQPAMETLSIIAYRQPMLRSDIEAIRGVDSGGVLKTLLERGLIRIIGKSDEAGSPLIYGTTAAFLEMFGLKDLKELPTLKEIEGLGIQERVGNIGKEELSEGATAEGVKEVVDEYKDDILEYKPDLEKEVEDSRNIRDLENSIKNLRTLEKEIFPKPTEELKAVLKEGEPDAEDAAEIITDETAPSQDTGRVE